MGRRKKETVELRFYEIPQGEPVLALLGEEWNRVYGHDSPYMHFHNLMEIGVCRNGEGVVVLDEKDYFNRKQAIVNNTFLSYLTYNAMYEEVGRPAGG